MPPRGWKKAHRAVAYEAPEPSRFRRFLGLIFNRWTVTAASLIVLGTFLLLTYYWFDFSDRIDRRYVLAAMSAIAALAGLLIFLLHPSSPAFLIGLVILYGAVANTLYPIAVAHANDFASSEPPRLVRNF